MLASTLATIHNERYIVRLVADVRAAIVADTFEELGVELTGAWR
jgi:queuine tRNA-ribosyltransferase